MFIWLKLGKGSCLTFEVYFFVAIFIRVPMVILGTFTKMKKIIEISKISF